MIQELRTSNLWRSRTMIWKAILEFWDDDGGERFDTVPEAAWGSADGEIRPPAMCSEA
jgi:hypothetical protein